MSFIYSPRKVIEKLYQDFDAAGKIADPMERLLAYRDLQERSWRAHEKTDPRGWSFVLGALAFGVVMSVNVAMLGLIPIVSFGSIGAMMLTYGAARLAAAPFGFTLRALAKIDALDGKREAATDKIIENLPTSEIARSSHFDKVMKSFPVLKEKFLAAAAREIKQTTAPVPPNQPQRKHSHA